MVASYKDTFNLAKKLLKLHRKKKQQQTYGEFYP